MTAFAREGKSPEHSAHTGPGESSVASQALPISAQFVHLKQQTLNLIAHVLMLITADSRNLGALPSHSG